MKPRILATIICTTATATAVSAQLGIPYNRPQGRIAGISVAPAVMGPSESILSDVINQERKINIFAGLTRDVSTVADRLESSGHNTTVLAPLNSVMSALPRKPWEDPEEYHNLGADAYEGAEGEQRAEENLRRFVEAHVVPMSPWPENHEAKTLDGRTLWWEEVDGARMVSRAWSSRKECGLIKLQIRPDNIEVESVPKQVANGEVWLVKSVVNYASKFAPQVRASGRVS